MAVRNIYKSNGKVPPSGIDIRRDHGPYGNPFTRAKYGDKCLELFKEYIEARVVSDPEYRALVMKLDGKDVYCVCEPRRCHGHIYENTIFKIKMGLL